MNNKNTLNFADIQQYIDKEIILIRGSVKVLARIKKVNNNLIYCSNFKEPLDLNNYSDYFVPK